MLMEDEEEKKKRNTSKPVQRWQNSTSAASGSHWVRFKDEAPTAAPPLEQVAIYLADAKM